MTIITKSGDKKHLIPLPIPRLETTATHNDEEAAIMDHQSRTRKTNCLVFLMALLVLLMGVLSGVCVYRQYLREKFQRYSVYFPYDNAEADQTETFWVNSPSGWRDGPTDDYKFNENYNTMDQENEHIRRFLQEFVKQLQQSQDELFNEARKIKEIEALSSESINEKFFREEIEIQDDDSDSYADITIPNFKDGRRGQFIHDFVNNLTTIVDQTARRCFVYPLDYTTTLPPKSLGEVMVKMQQKAYFPDMNALRQKMRVVVPPLEDDDDMISMRTALKCDGYRIYKLEPFVSGVYKRSIEEPLTSDGMFAEFAGKGIVNIDLLNIKEVEEFEKLQKM